MGMQKFKEELFKKSSVKKQRSQFQNSIHLRCNIIIAKSLEFLRLFRFNSQSIMVHANNIIRRVVVGWVGGWIDYVVR